MRIVGLLSLLLLGFAPPLAAQVRIVAAENFYGDVARQVAGPTAEISSILNNPETDPHTFEVSPSVGRSLAAATIVIMNGADYDPWMERLLAAQPAPGRVVINAADLAGHKAGDNPHVWFDPATMPAVARALAAALDRAAPSDAAEQARRLDAFLATLAPIDAKVADLRARHAGKSVTATEPVFGYMVAALGLTMRNERFQLAVMNDTEPRPSDIRAFEQDLRKRAVRVLIYNDQATDTTAKRLRDLARVSKVQVVGVTETLPPGVTYQAWITVLLDTFGRALARSTP